MMLTIVKSGHGELEDRRSRFIADAVAVDSRESVQARLSERRARYPDASHVVHAFVFGKESSTTVGMSDDHEPHGTAGRPVLDVIQGRELTNVLVTVVRYFGGTKLGTGGLVRAYSRAAVYALESATVEVLRDYLSFNLRLEYPHYDGVRRALEQLGARFDNEEFGVAVKMSGRIAAESKEEARREVADLSAGGAVLQFEDDEQLD